MSEPVEMITVPKADFLEMRAIIRMMYICEKEDGLMSRADGCGWDIYPEKVSELIKKHSMWDEFSRAERYAFLEAGGFDLQQYYQYFPEDAPAPPPLQPAATFFSRKKGK